MPPLHSFRISKEKAVRLAACESVPMVMVIAGPNGVGKSTLLSAIHRRAGTFKIEPIDTKVIYQPPHRAIRRHQVQRRYLSRDIMLIEDQLTLPQLQGLEGFSVPFPNRGPDNVDETGSTFKYSLGRIENQRQNALARLLDTHRIANSSVDASTIPDIYEPLNTLVHRLLPHLSFQRVDFSDEMNIRCEFARVDGATTDTLDLDDLSSGEKAVLLLFLPLIEDQITSRLAAITGSATSNSTHASRLFLIDEAEQHLHPDLQSRILSYLREESLRRGVQFIITTHSPTLVDQASDEELFILDFAKADEANQLRRVASTTERLETIRSLTGTTYPVTTGRSIVCIEGTRSSNNPTDLGLLNLLHPYATRYTFVPVGGKGQVLAVVPALRHELSEEHFGIAVYGLVDSDRSGSIAEGVATWPVAAIENLLLLDLDAAASCATDLLQKPISVTVIRDHLLEVAKNLRGDEIRLRVMERIGARTVRVNGTTTEEVLASLREAQAELASKAADAPALLTAATTEVDTLLSNEGFVRSFRGKNLLRGLYNRLGLHSTGASYAEFTYDLARRAASTAVVREILDEAFATFEQ